MWSTLQRGRLQVHIKTLICQDGPKYISWPCRSNEPHIIIHRQSMSHIVECTSMRMIDYAPRHRPAKLGNSWRGQCAFSSGSLQHIRQLCPSEQPKGLHQPRLSELHSQQWLLLSQYAPRLQSECESQVSGVCVLLPMPAPNSACQRKPLLLSSICVD
jgi:hypothetical protein